MSCVDSKHANKATTAVVLFDPDASSNKVVQKALQDWNLHAVIHGIQETWDAITEDDTYRSDANAVFREVLRQLLLMLAPSRHLRMNQNVKSWPVALEYMETMRTTGERSRMTITPECLWYALSFGQDIAQLRQMLALADDIELNARSPFPLTDTFLNSAIRMLYSEPWGRRNWEDYIRALLKRTNIDGTGVCIIKPQTNPPVVSLVYKEPYRTPSEFTQDLIDVIKREGGVRAVVRNTVPISRCERKRRLNLLPIILGEIQEREKEILHYRNTLPTLVHSILSLVPSFAQPLVVLCLGYLDFSLVLVT